MTKFIPFERYIFGYKKTNNDVEIINFFIDIRYISAHMICKYLEDSNYTQPGCLILYISESVFSI